MSEEERENRSPPEQGDAPFSAEQLDAFTEEKCKGGACPMCGCKDWWASVGDPSQRLEFVVNHKYVNGLFGNVRTAPVIWFVCSNCGFVRQHLEMVIRNWVNERP